MANTLSAGQAGSVRRAFSRVPWLLLLVLAAWLVVGFLRAEPVARDYFAHVHGDGATIENVDVKGVIPLLPPFWGVSITGDVREPQMTGPGYLSAMLLVVEPFTGTVFVFGAG
jgi:hypothetical protein